MKRSKEIIISLVVLGSIAMLYYGYYYLKGSNLFQRGNTYYALYDNVAGLNIDDPVSIHGYRIGKVRDAILIAHSNNILLEIELSNSEIKIPKDSRAIIINTGLLGGKEVDIELGTSSVMLDNGDTIVSGTEDDIFASLTSSLEPFEKKALEAVASIDSVMKLIQVVLDEKNRKQISKSLIHMTNTMQHLDSASSDLETFMKSEQVNLKKIIRNMYELTANLNEFSDTLNDLHFKATLQKANTALDNASNIMAKIDNGEGTMGQLINNDTLYTNLESASEALDELLRDLNEHPKRYVHFSIFGKKEKTEKDKSKVKAESDSN